MSRIANICPRLTSLQLTGMEDLTEEGKLSIANLFRQIIQHNPPIEVLSMARFSFLSYNDEKNIGELVLEALVTSNIDTIVDLNLRQNIQWFERPGNISLLVEVITKQTVIQQIDLHWNCFSIVATYKILTSIADHPSTTNKLQNLNLGSSANI